MKIFIRWYPWSIGVNHSFKEKKHRRERPMKNKIMKGSPRKTETDEIYPLFLTAPVLSEQLSTKPISLLPL